MHGGRSGRSSASVSVSPVGENKKNKARMEKKALGEDQHDPGETTMSVAREAAAASSPSAEKGNGTVEGGGTLSSFSPVASDASR